MRSVALTLVALLAATFVACGGGATTAAGPTVAVELIDFKFAPQTVEVPAGQKVTLELKNKGSVEHDFTIEAINLKTIVRAGQTATRVIGPFTAGTTYDLVCTTAGHKESGMVGKLIAR